MRGSVSRVLGAMRWISLMLVLGVGCGASAVQRAADERDELIEEGEALFRAHGVEGAFVARRANGDLVAGADVDRRFIPASTFKIANTIIGVETGVIPDASFTLQWDGVEREFPAWNRDHDLRSAIGESVVWWYQEVARRVGPERMREHVSDLRYGNAETGDEVDRFWLDGPLAISPREQVDFLQRLTEGALPVSARSTRILREVLPSDAHGAATIRSKTGTYWSRDGGDSHAWRVGWVEQGGEVRGWFALLITGAEVEQLWEAREPLSVTLLQRAGLLDR